MSRTNKAGKPGTVRDTVRHALDQAGPVAKNTTAAVRHGVIRSRAWAAPQMERTGEFLQEVAAPKVSEVLSAAAHKIEPAQPRRRRWMRRAGAGLLAAIGVTATAAGAAAAVLRKNTKPATEHTSDDDASEAQTPQHVADA
ncbi:MAG TPA: hypothetical protein VME44_22045 [Streptosporangiaceae bacterium]|nr:hypothetical protein [Streptosporangiaceae bacterium]